MNLIVYLAAGGVVGWLGSLVLRTDARHVVVLNVVVAVVGALLGGWLLLPLLTAETVSQGEFSSMGLLVSFVGAFVLLLLVNLVRKVADQ